MARPEAMTLGENIAATPRKRIGQHPCRMILGRQAVAKDGRANEPACRVPLPLQRASSLGDVVDSVRSVHLVARGNAGIFCDQVTFASGGGGGGNELSSGGHSATIAVCFAFSIAKSSSPSSDSGSPCASASPPALIFASTLASS